MVCSLHRPPAFIESGESGWRLSVSLLAVMSQMFVSLPLRFLGFFGPQIWWESRFLRVVLSVWFYEPWEHDSCVWVTSKCSLWFTAADKGPGCGRGGLQRTVCDEFWSAHCQALICLLRWQLFSLCSFIYVTFPLTRVIVARLHKQPPFTFKKRSSPNIIHDIFNPCSITV